MDDFAYSAGFWPRVAVGSPDEGRVLALGDVSLWHKSGALFDRTSEIFLSDFAQLNAATLADIMPDLVLSPVVTARFDCLEVAHRLAALGYSGSYRALARDLPDPSLIRAEILRDCPGLDFDILNVHEIRARAN